MIDLIFKIAEFYLYVCVFMGIIALIIYPIVFIISLFQKEEKYDEWEKFDGKWHYIKGTHLDGKDLGMNGIYKWYKDK